MSLPSSSIEHWDLPEDVNGGFMQSSSDLLNSASGSGLRGSRSRSRSSTLPMVDATGSSIRRFLGRSKDQRSADGTLAVLVIVSALFFFIWAPVMVRRCRRQSNEQELEMDTDLARFEAEARAVRAALQRMDQEPASGRETALSSMTLENRREFLDNALLTKKVIFKSEASVCTQDYDADSVAGKDEDISVDDRNNNNHNRNTAEASSDDKETAASASLPPIKRPAAARKPPKRQKSNLVVLLKSKTKETTTNDNNDNNNNNNQTSNPSAEDEAGRQQEEPYIDHCAICLAEYEDGEEICWSHNDKCPHYFHRQCVQEWLLTHEDCPCCRQDFLCLWGEDEDYEGRTTTTAVRRDSSSNNNTNSTAPNGRRVPLDWASELAEEIQQRIMERNAMVGDAQEQDGHNNAVLSVADLHLAAGLLLYRHFPWLLSSDYPVASNQVGGNNNNNNNETADVLELPMNALFQNNNGEQLGHPAVVVDLSRGQHGRQHQQQQQHQNQQRDIAMAQFPGQVRSQPYRQRLRSYVMHNRDRLVREGRHEAARAEAPVSREEHADAYTA